MFPAVSEKNPKKQSDIVLNFSARTLKIIFIYTISDRQGFYLTYQLLRNTVLLGK